MTEKVVHLLLGCMGWNYQFSPKEWKSLKGTNIAIGGGKKDKIVPPYMDLAAYLKSHGITSNVWVRDEDHNTFNFECMRCTS
jgi:predicted esterase